MKTFINKFTKIVSITMIFAMLCGCGNTQSFSNANNQTNTIDSDMMNLVDFEKEKEIYYKGYSENKDAFENVTNEQIQELIKNKNRDLESTNFHSENSYEAEMQTAVRIEQRNETHDFHIYTGNYYDIDEKYLYIITCRHAMIEQDYAIAGMSEKAKSDLIKFNMTPQEICDTIHEINLIDSQGNYQTFYNYSCVISHNADIALIAIDINEVNEDILNNVKTIDISKINQDIDNTYGFLYCCKRPTVDETFVQKKISLVTRDRGMIYFNQFKSSPTMFGNSGGGVFDKNGYYLGEIYNGYVMTSTAIVIELPQMFNELYK